MNVFLLLPFFIIDVFFLFFYLYHQGRHVKSYVNWQLHSRLKKLARMHTCVFYRQGSALPWGDIFNQGQAAYQL